MANGSSNTQFEMLPSEVVTSDNMSPAPCIVANRMTIALSEIITEDTDPQQADKMAFFSAERISDAVSPVFIFPVYLFFLVLITENA
jgi:hypothetical protein